MRVLFFKEIREALASRRFLVISALCLFLVPLGFHVSQKSYQAKLQNYKEAVRIYEEETKTVSDILYNEGGKAFAPPSPLSFLSLGLELVLPNVAETQYKNMAPPAVMRLSNSQGRDDLYDVFYGSLDLIFVVGVVMSLLAIILTYGSIAGEKEQGTLKQVLSNPVARNKIILSKALANGVVLFIPFLIAITLSLIWANMQSETWSFLHGDWTLIGVAVFISILLVGAFLNLGLLISALAKQAVPALVALLLVWVFFYGIHPRLSSAAAQILYWVKSEGRVALEKSQLQRNIYKELDEEIDRQIQSLPESRANFPTEEDRRKQDEIRGNYQTRLEQSWRILDNDVEERRKFRMALASNIARLSPTSCFIRALSEVSRTGWLEYEQFSKQSRQYEELLNRDIFSRQRVLRHKRGIGVWSEADVRAPAPAFAYVPVPVEMVLLNILPDVVLLFLFNLIFFAGALAAFLRYDVR